MRIPDDIINLIENTIEGDNTTEKVRNYICSGIISRDILLYEKDKCKARLEYIERSLNNNPFYNKEALSEPELEFIRKTLEAMERKPKEFKENPMFMHANKNIYNKEFAKSITTKEFELLLYKFKDGISGKKQTKQPARGAQEGN